MEKGFGWPDGAYAYNYSGADELSSTRELGLGGFIASLPPKNPADIAPISEAKVLAPSDMIAFGDSPIARTLSPPRFDQFVGYVNLSEGAVDPLLVYGFGLATSKFVTDPTLFARPVQAMQRRHQRRWVVSFVDGHVETAKITNLINLANPDQRRRWNNDNLPHPERMAIR